MIEPVSLFIRLELKNIALILKDPTAGIYQSINALDLSLVITAMARIKMFDIV